MRLERNLAIRYAIRAYCHVIAQRAYVLWQKMRIVCTRIIVLQKTSLCISQLCRSQIHRSTSLFDNHEKDPDYTYHVHKVVDTEFTRRHMSIYLQNLTMILIVTTLKYLFGNKKQYHRPQRKL